VVDDMCNWRFSGVYLSNIYEVQLVAIYTYIIYTCLVIII
jgi:hypothetical protein